MTANGLQDLSGSPTVRDFAFYNAGISDGPAGPRRLVVPIRRVLRRVLRPVFFRQETIYRDLQDQIDALARRQEELGEAVQALAGRLAATDAFGWDYVAMARRLAAIEDRLDTPRAAAGANGHRLDGATPGLLPPHRLEPARAAPGR